VLGKPCVRCKTPAKLLIVAEHASAQFGGEALVPYQYFKCLREVGVDVHLLVHSRTKAELCGAFPQDISRLHFVADSLINIWCFKLGRRLPDRLAVFTFGVISHFDTQIRQRWAGRDLIKKYNLNIIHEPIPVSPKQPSLIFGLGLPVVIGPLNGGMDYPPNYNMANLFERLMISILRWSSNIWNKIIPGKRLASLILVANRRTYDALPLCIKNTRVREFVENGVDVDRFTNDAGRKPHDYLSVVYLGRLVDWKRVDLLIQACWAFSGRLNFRVHIVGDGPERTSLEGQVRRLSLTGSVQFHGWLPQVMAAKLLAESDVMVLPSMRECGGAVVLEAMASGLPVVSANWGGPADYITKDTGILIPPGTPESFIKELANALLWMAQNPERRIKMGQAGRERVLKLYDWRKKAKAILEIYEEVLAFADDRQPVIK
jgi:glycosyltransferase involved in cell wall biosynthesis